MSLWLTVHVFERSLPFILVQHVFTLIFDHYLLSRRCGLKLLVSLWENSLFTNLTCVGLQIIGRVKADPDFLPRLSVSNHSLFGIKYNTLECTFRCVLKELSHVCLNMDG